MRRILIILLGLCFTFSTTAIAQGNGSAVTLDAVDGLYDGNIPINIPGWVVFHFGYTNGDGANKAKGITNGFELCASGGATWTPGPYGDEFPWGPAGNVFDLVWSMNEFSWDGQGCDTIGFGGSVMLGPGLPPGFSGPAVYMSVDFSTGGGIDGETFCIDSCYYPPSGTWMWAYGSTVGSFPPSWGGPHCWNLFEVHHHPPEFINPILLAGGDHCDPIVLQYSAVDYEGDQIVFSVEAGVGSIDPNSGVYTYTPTLADVGANILATIGVNSVPAYGGPNTVVLTMNFTNEAPTIVCDPGAVPIGAGRTGRAGFTIDDVDCDPSTVYIGSITPTPLGNIYIDGNEVVFETDPDDALAGTSFTVEVCVTDGLDASCCEVVFDILCCGGMEVKIEKTHNSYQGQHEVVDITLEEIPVDMGGFDFLMAYDASALGLQSAIPGPAFYDPAPDGCGWEYFSFRFGPFGNCGNACPSGMVRVFGMAETNNGPNHPACFMPDSLPATLFTLDFLVSNDRTLECQYAPIQFFWTDCGDNSVSSVDGEVLYVSDHIYEFEGTDITDPYFGFPTYFGVQSECLNPDPDKPTVVNFIDFINGGVDIVCADSIDDRGDINLNGVVNEVADAVLYSNYFVQGISVFNVNVDGQIAASDVNADGITLSVADLVYQIRIITGDAPPYPKVGSELAVYAYENGVMSIDLMMGAAFIVLEGEVHPRLLAENMEMNYAFDGLNTRVLVSKVERGAGFEGDFLAFDARIVSFDGATYDGAPVAAKIVPTSYQLHQNYPNPFNPNTTMSFGLPYGGDYSISIYNVSGQTVASFSGSAEPGTVSIDWDASAQASGVYFYKLDTDDFTDTKKMVLLK